MHHLCLMLQLAASPWQTAHDNAYALLHQGKFVEAKSAFEAALPLARQQPPSETALASTLNSLGFVALRDGKLTDARRRFEEALEAMRAVPASGPSPAIIEANLGQAFWQSGDFAGAERHLKRAITISSAHRPVGDPATAQLETILAGIIVDAGRIEEAISILKGARAHLLVHLPPADTAVITNALRLARALSFAGHLEEARALMVETEPLTAGTGAHVEALALLGDIYRFQFDFARAVPLLRKALAQARALGDRNAQFPPLLSLALVDIGEGRIKLAEIGIREALAILDERYGPRHPVRANALIHLAFVRSQQGFHQSAIGDLDEASAILESYPSNTPHDWTMQLFIRAAAELGLGNKSAHDRFAREAYSSVDAVPGSELAAILQSYTLLLRKIDPKAAKSADRQSQALLKTLRP